MDTIFLTTANSKTENPHKYSCKLINAMHLDDHYVCLTYLSMYYTWKNIRASYGNNTLKYKIGDKLVNVILPDGSYLIDDINNNLHMMMIANGDAISNNNNDYPASIYPNKTFNRVSVVLKPNCELELGEGMAKILGFSNPVISNTSQGDLVPKLERERTVLVHSNLAQNNFTQDSSMIYSFTPDSAFGTLLHEKPSFPLWRNTRKTSDIREIDIWFTDQNYRPLEIEDDICVVIQLVKSNFISKA